MKIRTGFVSNSSSSSFLIHGLWIKINDAYKALLDKGIVTKEETIEEGWDEYDAVYYKLTALGLDVKSPPDEETCIGLNYLNMDMNETRKEFVDRAKRLLGDNLGVDESKIEDVEYGWYQG